MQGLLGGEAPQQEQQAQQGQQGKGSQAQYDMAAGQMIQWIASDQGYQASLQAMKTDVAQGMATVLGRLLMMVNQSAIMSGKKLDPTVLFQAAAESAKALSALAVKAQLTGQQGVGALAKDAFYDGLAVFAKEASEEALTPQDRQAYVAMMDKVEQMEQQGVMPKGQEPVAEGAA